MLTVGNVGHTEVVLCREGQVHVITTKHTASNVNERKRIRDKGGFISEVMSVSSFTVYNIAEPMRLLMPLGQQGERNVSGNTPARLQLSESVDHSLSFSSHDSSDTRGRIPHYWLRWPVAQRQLQPSCCGDSKTTQSNSGCKTSPRSRTIVRLFCQHQCHRRASESGRDRSGSPRPAVPYRPLSSSQTALPLVDGWSQYTHLW